MVSSVRHPEHVRQALLLGAHACTIPWNVMRNLTANNLTTVGAEQFLEHARLMTVKAGEVIREQNPVCKLSGSISDAIDQMTESRLGAVSIVNDENQLVGIFTDGDIRRKLKEYGEKFVHMKMSDFSYKRPVTVTVDTLLHEVVNVFGSHDFDNIIVVENNIPLGMIDVQDLVNMNLLG
jgi:CBS domain-containing protein